MIKYLPNQGFIISTMEELKYKILDSIAKIDKSEWDLLFGDIPEGYDFFKTVEKSRLPGYSFSYIAVYQGNELLLIAPLFIRDFNLDIAVEGWLQRLILVIRKFIPRFLVLKTLFCGSPFDANGILGLKPGYAHNRMLIQELTRIMESVCRKKNAPFIIFKDFLKDDLITLEPLKERGFFTVESFPTVVLELPFNSLEDYFKSLSRNSRKNLRRKIKKAKLSSDIRVKVANNVEDIIDRVYGLYLNTYNAGKVKFEKLTPDFFINAGRALAAQSKFFLYFLGERLVAFNFCFVHKDTLIDKFIGLDYDSAYEYNLYFFSWCYNIEWCLRNSIRYYQVGQTDYHPKLKLGGKLIPLYAYVKHNNPILNLLLQGLAKLFTPDNFDENIKSHG